MSMCHMLYYGPQNGEMAHYLDLTSFPTWFLSDPSAEIYVLTSSDVIRAILHLRRPKEEHFLVQLCRDGNRLQGGQNAKFTGDGSFGTNALSVCEAMELMMVALLVADKLRINRRLEHQNKQHTITHSATHYFLVLHVFKFTKLSSLC